jgi:hypothetical protein
MAAETIRHFGQRFHTELRLSSCVSDKKGPKGSWRPSQALASSRKLEDAKMGTRDFLAFRPKLSERRQSLVLPFITKSAEYGPKLRQNAGGLGEPDWLVVQTGLEPATPAM